MNPLFMYIVENLSALRSVLGIGPIVLADFEIIPVLIYPNLSYPNLT